MPEKNEADMDVDHIDKAEGQGEGAVSSVLEVRATAGHASLDTESCAGLPPAAQWTVEGEGCH